MKTTEPELLPAENQAHYQPPSNELTTRGTQSLDTARPEPSIGEMLRVLVAGGITNENVQALEKLTDLYERMEVKKAERAFADAFVSLQKDLPTIIGRRQVPGKQGIKFAYANFDDIDEIVRPICLRHGFTYAFHEGGIADGRVTMIMTLQHAGGHSRPVPFSVRIGSGPPGATESQADMSGHEYAKRGAIESGLSLRIIGVREDARMEGGPITPAQADELERRVAETNSNKEKFLAVAGVKTFATIPAGSYTVLDAMLRQKEQGR